MTFDAARNPRPTNGRARLLSYVGSRDYNLYALDARTGRLRWKFFDTDSWIVSSPAVSGGTIYVGGSDSHRFYAIDERTGAKMWEYHAPSNVFTSPAVSGDTVYFGCGDIYRSKSPGYVFALDAGTGKERWQFKVEGNVYSSPVLDGGVLYFGSEDGNLYALR